MCVYHGCGAHAKGPITKRPKLKTAHHETVQAQNDPSSKRPKLETTQAQNGPRLKATQAQNNPSSKQSKLKTTHGAKRPTAQKDPWHRRTQGTKRPKAQNDPYYIRHITTHNIIIVSLPCTLSNNFLCSICF